MSTLTVDNLKGKTTAKTITVTVGATATQSLEQGLAKAWSKLTDDADTNSFNVSGTTDNGTAGNTTITFTNNMANVNYALATCILEDFNMVCISTAQTTSNYTVQVENTSNSVGDANSSSIVMGDLA